MVRPSVVLTAQALKMCASTNMQTHTQTCTSFQHSPDFNPLHFLFSCPSTTQNSFTSLLKCSQFLIPVLSHCAFVCFSQIDHCDFMPPSECIQILLKLLIQGSSLSAEGQLKEMMQVGSMHQNDNFLGHRARSFTWSSTPKSAEQ